MKLGRTARRRRVSGESIMEFPLVAPPSGVLDAFNRACQPLLDRILSNHAESRTLARMRDALLPKLLSGELSVKNLPVLSSVGTMDVVESLSGE